MIYKPFPALSKYGGGTLELGYSTVDSLKADLKRCIYQNASRGGKWIGAFSMFTGGYLLMLKTPSMSLKN